MSGVPCLVSGVMCCVSHYTYHLSHVPNANSQGQARDSYHQNSPPDLLLIYWVCLDQTYALFDQSNHSNALCCDMS